MLTSSNYSRVFILAFMFVLNDFCFCMPLEFNVSQVDSFMPAIGTWYGAPNGAGSDGGACGFGNDVGNAIYNGLISAGNGNIFKSGAGCGACYLIRCKENPACSGKPVIVTITDECPGCNDSPYHFDLSGKAFGFLAKPGQADALRNAGKINLEFMRWKCSYKANILFKIVSGSNPFYLGFVVENVNGNGEIKAIDILRAGGSWKPMQRVFGESWKYDVPGGETGPYSVRITDSNSKSVVANNVLPRDWAPGRTYYSSVNF